MMRRGQWRPWDLVEDEILERDWKAGIAVRAIAGLLGRSRNSVISRAYRMGIGNRYPHPDAKFDTVRMRTAGHLEGAASPRDGGSARLVKDIVMKFLSQPLEGA